MVRGILSFDLNIISHVHEYLEYVCSKDLKFVFATLFIGKDIESLFAKELKRRGLSPSSSVDLDSDIAAREAAGTIGAIVLLCCPSHLQQLAGCLGVICLQVLQLKLQPRAHFRVQPRRRQEQHRRACQASKARGRGLLLW